MAPDEKARWNHRAKPYVSSGSIPLMNETLLVTSDYVYYRIGRSCWGTVDYNTDLGGVVSMTGKRSNPISE